MMVLESAYGKIRKALASDLLEKIKQCPPAFSSAWWWSCW